MGIRDKMSAGVKKQTDKLAQSRGKKAPAKLFDSASGGPALSNEGKRNPNKTSKTRSAWEQWRGMSTAERSATQDIHSTQNFERGEIGEVKGKTLPEVLAALIGLLAFVFTWLIWGMFGFAIASSGIGDAFGSAGNAVGGAYGGNEQVVTAPDGGAGAQGGAGADPNLNLQEGTYEYDMYLKYADAPNLAGTASEWDALGKELGVRPFYQEGENRYNEYVALTCYYPLDQAGNVVGDCTERLAEPDWHKYEMLVAMGIIAPQSHSESTGTGPDADGAVSPEGSFDADGNFVPGDVDGSAGAGGNATGDMDTASNPDGLGAWLLFGHSNWLRWLVSLVVGAVVWGVARKALMLQLSAQNLMYDNRDINQYHNDQHIALVEEVVERYQVFPDVGAHSEVQPSSMLSHVMLLNKGIKTIEMAERAKEDIVDEHGNVEIYKGEILYDDDGNPKMYETEMFDHEFAHDLFDKSGLERVKRLRQFLDAREAPSNPGGKIFGKLEAETVADHINKYWTFPYYEPQRPAGAYIVDEAPVNTMILAMTRAGKGNVVPAC